MYWSPSSATALAEAELEYDDNHTSQAAFVKFRITKLPPILETLQGSRPVYALIWTTTPWTLPANRAIAVHPELSYCVVTYKEEYIIIASTRFEEVATAAKISPENLQPVLKNVRGIDLANGAEYVNDLHSPHSHTQNILAADYVSSLTGTGLVHIAPGHGFDDYELCKAYKLDAFAPVDDHGLFTDQAIPSQPEALLGKPVLKEGTTAVLDLLKNKASSQGASLIWATYRYKHKYPIDWRTKLPVIIRATAQWFADVNDIKGTALRSLDNVNFIPESGKPRLRSFVAGRNSWCISRQRAWGVPIPVLYRLQDGEKQPILSDDSVAHIINTIIEFGTDAWWTDPEGDPKWLAASLAKGKYVRGRDTMDVWFDSGTTWTQLDLDSDCHSSLADVYVEGSDQHRGWFQSSLLTRISCLANHGSAPRPVAPFKNLITHGFILDEKGHKMSKSIGNVIGPDQIIDGTLLPPVKVKTKGQKHPDPGRLQYDAMGPDALRLWVAKNDYTNDIAVGENVLRGVNGALRKYRLTLKWLLGVLHDYDDTVSSIAGISSKSLDLSNRLALRHLTKTARNVHTAYARYEPFKAMQELEHYVNVDLSSFYVETAKDAIYTSTENDRLCAQYVCNEILQTLLVMLAPAIPLLVAECVHYASAGVRQSMKCRRGNPLECIWTPNPVFEDKGGFKLSLDQQNGVVEKLRQAVNRAQEQLRVRKEIGSSFECCVVLRRASDNEHSDVEKFLKRVTQTEELARALVVSEVHLEGDATGQPSQSSSNGSSSSTVKQLLTGGPLDEGSYEVTVQRAQGFKCPRCWRYTISAAEKQRFHNTENGHICGRCRRACKMM